MSHMHKKGLVNDYRPTDVVSVTTLIGSHLDAGVPYTPDVQVTPSTSVYTIVLACSSLH